MLRDHLLCPDLCRHIERNRLLIPGRHHHPGLIVFYVAQGAGDNVTDTVDQSDREGRTIINLDIDSLLRNKFRLGCHNGAACRRLRHFVDSPAAPVLFLHVRQNNGVHKLLNKGGFSCPNRPYYTDIDIAVGTFRNIPVNAAIFHFSSPLNWTAWESEAFPWLPFFRIPNRSPAGLPPSRCSRSVRCPITPRPALRNTGQGRRNYPAPGA